MFENQIKAAKTELLEHVHTGQQFVYLRDLRAQEDVHAFYVNFFAAEVEWWLLEQRMLRVANPRFDYSDADFNAIFDSMDALSRREARFDAHDLKSVLDLAVKTRINYLLRPRTTLKWFVFRGEPTKPLREVLMRMAYLNAYQYLTDGFRRWADSRRADDSGMDLLSVVEFERALETIDNDEILDYSTNEFADLLDPIFEFFGEVDPATPQRGIPTPALIVFLDDKGVFRISQELEKRIRTEQLNFIHKSDFLRVIEDVLHEVEEDPDAQTPEQQTELSRDFAATSELNENTFGDEEVDEYVISASFEGDSEESAPNAADGDNSEDSSSNDSDSANVFSLPDHNAQIDDAPADVAASPEYKEDTGADEPGAETLPVQTQIAAADNESEQNSNQDSTEPPPDIELHDESETESRTSDDSSDDSLVDTDEAQSLTQADDTDKQPQADHKQAQAPVEQTGQESTPIDEPESVFFSGADELDQRAALQCNFADDPAGMISFDSAENQQTVFWNDNQIANYERTFLFDPDFEAKPQSFASQGVKADTSEDSLVAAATESESSPSSDPSQEAESSEPESNAPESSEPAVDEPEANDPAASEPEADEPESSEATANEPEANEPEADEPSANEPSANDPESSEPEVNEPSANEPESSEPAVDEPEAVDPEADEPEADEPEANEPEADEPSANDPESSEPEVNEPSANEPEASEPEADEPEASEPSASEPEASEPEAEEPSANEPEASEATDNQPVTSEATVDDPAAEELQNPVAQASESTNRAPAEDIEKSTVSEYSEAELLQMYAVADAQRDKIIKKVFGNDSARFFSALQSVSQEKHWKAALNRVDLILAEQDVNPMAPAAAAFRQLIINRYAAE